MEDAPVDAAEESQQTVRQLDSYEAQNHGDQHCCRSNVFATKFGTVTQVEKGVLLGSSVSHALSKGRGPRVPYFFGFLLIPTTSDLERPNSARE